MTTMIVKFFGLHQELIRSGLLAKMKIGETKLYLYLMHESERCRTREIKRTDSEIAGRVGVAPRTLCNARKKLQEFALIRCQRGDGNKYIYTICNAETGKPYEGSPKVQARYERKTAGTNGDCSRGISPKHRIATERPIPANSYKPLEQYGEPGVFDD